jgi:hypothetical protein
VCPTAHTPIPCAEGLNLLCGGQGPLHLAVVNSQQSQLRMECQDLCQVCASLLWMLLSLKHSRNMLWYLGFLCRLQACVAGMFEYRDFGAFKQHLRDFLVQVPG